MAFHHIDFLSGLPSNVRVIPISKEVWARICKDVERCAAGAIEKQERQLRMSGQSIREDHTVIFGR